MRVLVVLPAAKGVYPAEAEQRRVDVVSTYSSPDVEIEVGFPAEVSGFMPFGGTGTLGENALQVTRNHLLMGERMVRAEQDGFHACIPFGMLDFGVEVARSQCQIPVVGQAQATYCMAAMMVGRIGVITYQSRTHQGTWRQLRDYGFLPMLVGLGAAEMPNDEMPHRREELFERFVGEGKRLVKDGAELIVCHGMSMSPVEFPAQEFVDAIGVPVLEGMGCAVAMAQAWVRLGTQHR